MSLFYIFFVFLIYSPAAAAAAAIPLFVPIVKDHSTLQYTIDVYLKTPPKVTKLFLDLGGKFSWVNCQAQYNSTTYHHIDCSTPLCTSFDSLACSNCYEPPGPSCANNTCGLFPENPVTVKAQANIALVDSLGFTLDKPGLIPNFIFSCSLKSLLKGLASGVSGLAGFGRSTFSLTAQVSSTLSVPFSFALCLPSSPSAPGVAFFGSSGPYVFYPGIDLSKSLIYTPLIVDPVGSTIITYYQIPSDDYYIGLTSIKVNGKAIAINKTILTVNNDTGFGGTKIRTVHPYTILQTSIYEVFIAAFKNESAALNLTLTDPVKPFDVCYLASHVSLTRVGPAFPTVDLVMHSEDVFWRLFGSNSMVRITKKGKKDVWCLAFLNGGVNAETAVVIGGHQMEDNLLQFDVGMNRFGFSSSLLAQGTNCTGFNFIKKT